MTYKEKKLYLSFSFVGWKVQAKGSRLMCAKDTVSAPQMTPFRLWPPGACSFSSIRKAEGTGSAKDFHSHSPFAGAKPVVAKHCQDPPANTAALRIELILT